MEHGLDGPSEGVTLDVVLNAAMVVSVAGLGVASKAAIGAAVVAVIAEAIVTADMDATGAAVVSADRVHAPVEAVAIGAAGGAAVLGAGVVGFAVCFKPRV